MSHASLWYLALAPGIVLLAMYAFFYAQFASQLIAFPFDWDQGEGYDAWSAWLINEGRLPYTANADYPYYSSNYPPVWSYVVSVPMAWLGPGLGPARAVSVAATALTALTLVLATRRRSGLGLAGLLAAGLFLASPYVFHTTPLARVNSTMLLFSVVAVALVQVPTRSRVALACLSLLVALFTKQTALDAAVATLGYVLLTRRWLGVAASVGVALVGMAGVAALTVATHGAFWLNVVVGNANPFDLSQLQSYFSNFAMVHVVILTFAVLEVLVSIRARRASPWALYFIAALVMGLAAGKWGAGESYFLGAIAAASVLAACFVSRALRWAPRAGAFGGIGVALLAQALLFSHGPLSQALPWLPDRGFQSGLLGHGPTQADLRAGKEIVTALRGVPGRVLVEDPSFAVVAGKGVTANATHLRNLEEVGMWDPSELVSDLRRRRYDTVVLNAELYPEPVLSAIGRSYYLARTVSMNGFTYKVFLPGSD